MYTLQSKGRLLPLQTPVVMGIINITPDSFYAASRQQNISRVLSQAEKMLGEGAQLLDIGGQSTRPGAERVGEGEELRRVIPAMEAVHQHFPDAWLSIDTFYSRVASEAVAVGASLVNDVSAGQIDADMLTTVARLNVPYVCMHMQGEPQSMQVQPKYNDVVVEIIDFFIRRLAACRKAGITDVIVDPGFGFGKTIEHNFQLLHRLESLHLLGVPVLVGLSRKSTIYKTLKISPEEALNGTTVLNTLALLKGAHILRVHDVKEALEAVALIQAFNVASNK